MKNVKFVLTATTLTLLCLCGCGSQPETAAPVKATEEVTPKSMISALRETSTFEGEPKKFVEDAIASKDFMKINKSVPVLGEAVRLKILTKAEATDYMHRGVAALTDKEEKELLQNSIPALDKYENLSK
jgi:hypothetical protein